MEVVRWVGQNVQRVLVPARNRQLTLPILARQLCRSPVRFSVTHWGTAVLAGATGTAAILPKDADLLSQNGVRFRETEGLVDRID